ncbi:MAG TPA: hypothetical protein VGF67_13895 [Ktedonobacteraceae bacterium]|jgi:hypothetical protein
MEHRLSSQYLDTQLMPLISSVAHAIETRGIVAMLSLWQPVSALALLPFSLHARWPDRIDGLPLSATMSLLPCSGADRRLLEMPLCTPKEAYRARAYARWYRNEMQTNQDGDFQLVDWEEGYYCHQAAPGQRLLGANSFVAVDAVQPGELSGAGLAPIWGDLLPATLSVLLCVSLVGEP